MSRVTSLTIIALSQTANAMPVAVHNNMNVLPSPSPSPGPTAAAPAVGCHDDPTYEDDFMTCADWAGAESCRNSGNPFIDEARLIRSCPESCHDITPVCPGTSTAAHVLDHRHKNSEHQVLLPSKKQPIASAA